MIDLYSQFDIDVVVFGKSLSKDAILITSITFVQTFSLRLQSIT